MPRLSLNERVRVTALAAARSRRKALSRALNSPLLRWRYGSAAADQLLLVPQELRTADPSFWQEIDVGQFGLAGSLAIVGEGSPFDARPPSEAWARALHGFGWLRHLAAADEPEAAEAARALAVEWVNRHRSGAGIAWEPAVMARRLIAWITHAGLLLEDTDARTYDILTGSLGHQLVRLSATWRTAQAGMPRLVSLIAIVLADLTIAGYERQLDDAERALMDELDRQILPDGGHLSRDASVLVDLMLDLLPLSQCFTARGRAVPPVLAKAMTRSFTMLRHMRMGDGSLARFNGVGIATPAHLATVLAYDETTGEAAMMPEAAHSGYVRLVLGRTIVLADTGAAPPLEFAGRAHAGALSFEMSVGRHLVFVNGGAPPASDPAWRTRSRATVSHNTLCLGEKSSSKMVRHPFLEEIAGATPIRFPREVRATVMAGEAPGRIGFSAHHDGYAHRFGLLHHRQIVLSHGGQRIEGSDRIAGKGHAVRLKRDLPFSIHFHVHPDATVSEGGGEGRYVVEVADGTRFLFEAAGVASSLEESIHFADSAGPRRALQIVLRGATVGEAEVHWSLTAAGTT
ncbi:MAG: heparinase II/III family protein [Hyphomicrobiaceae bacterium]|nr:heparinase II/III family protein [Hyphomicrobiaceae bacterium]